MTNWLEVSFDEMAAELIRRERRLDVHGIAPRWKGDSFVWEIGSWRSAPIGPGDKGPGWCVARAASPTAALAEVLRQLDEEAHSDD